MAANQEITTTTTTTSTTPSTAAAESSSSLASSDRHGQRRPVDYLCVLDFEATCHQGKKPRPQEIIEFPTVLLNASTGQVVEPEFHLYIRPDVHPNLSDFCTELTGITQSTIDEKGISLFEALDQHRQWLASPELIPWHLSGGCNGDNHDSDHQTYVTCGDWDLKHCLPSQLAYRTSYHDERPRHLESCCAMLDERCIWSHALPWPMSPLITGQLEQPIGDCVDEPMFVTLGN